MRCGAGVDGAAAAFSAWFKVGPRGYGAAVTNPTPVPEDLRRLAAAHGVATSYNNERREPVEVDADAGDFCYSLSAAKIARATMAHVHSGAAGANGPPVITLELGSDLCVAAEPELLKKIVAAPQDYYVNVHNAEFPAGAVRGQLGRK